MYEAVNAKREKMLITKLGDPRTVFETQFNPEEFTEGLQVNYQRHKIPGLSHEPLQYVNTTNVKFSMDLYFDAVTNEQADRNLIARRFLSSVCYPKRPVGDLLIGGPPRLLFVWPHIISLTTVITSLQFVYSQFSSTGVPIKFTASISLEEIRDMRLTQDDVIENGTIRGPGPDDPTQGT
jgi:hypothetical protein